MKKVNECTSDCFKEGKILEFILDLNECFFQIKRCDDLVVATIFELEGKKLYPFVAFSNKDTAASLISQEFEPEL